MKKKVLSVIKFVVPVVLLYYIFSIIDFERLTKIITDADLLLLSLVLLSVPIQYLLFTVRWHLLLDLIEQVKTNFRKLHSILYKGLFVGFFVPGGVGIDVYRVLKVRKEYAIYKSNISTIFLEKIVGTASSLILIIVCYPFLEITKNETIAEIINYAYILIGAFCILLFLIGFKNAFLKGKFEGVMQQFMLFLNAKIISLINKISSKNHVLSHDEKIVEDIIKPVLSLKYISIVFFFSIVILIVKALFINIVFYALGFDIPFLANLFVVPLVNIISLIPISFGGVGVRESAYILFYGYFGIPVEVSLIVSLITFTFLLFNIFFGGLLMVRENISDT
ncbi:MAG: lysylphosphatidylglycerol synthase transmembrane domain-containing protein [Bacteroidales bacterium]